MNERYQLVTAVSAILLAVIFPIYWVSEFWQISERGGAAVYQNISTLSAGDLVFLIIGALGTLIYLGLKRFLNQRYAYHSADLILILLAVTTAVFTLGTLFMDLITHFFGDQLFLSWHMGSYNGVTVSLFISLIVFGVLDLVLGILLITHAKQMSGAMLAFAILTLIQGIVEITVIFALSTIFIYPLAMLVLAVNLLSRPQELEVV
ncbi:MAG: hypothetical protein MK188_01835 [Gammaproteobacteria bacterium]|nr:hypothetical protein [Gammaproteobacteria bacterium]